VSSAFGWIPYLEEIWQHDSKKTVKNREKRIREREREREIEQVELGRQDQQSILKMAPTTYLLILIK